MNNPLMTKREELIITSMVNDFREVLKWLFSAIVFCFIAQVIGFSFILWLIPMAFFMYKTYQSAGAVGLNVDKILKEVPVSELTLTEGKETNEDNNQFDNNKEEN